MVRALGADAEGVHGLGQVAAKYHPDPLALEDRADDERLGLVAAAAHLHEAGSGLRPSSRPLGEWNHASAACHGDHASITPSPSPGRQEAPGASWHPDLYADVLDRGPVGSE